MASLNIVGQTVSTLVAGPIFALAPLTAVRGKKVKRGVCKIGQCCKLGSCKVLALVFSRADFCPRPSYSCERKKDKKRPMQEWGV